MHRHQSLAGGIGHDPPGQQRDPDPRRSTGNDGFDRAEFQRFGRQHTEAGQQRIQTLAIGTADAKHHGLEVLDVGDIVQAVQGR